jgi:hypothetical protein
MTGGNSSGSISVEQTSVQGFIVSTIFKKPYVEADQRCGILLLLCRNGGGTLA